MEEISEKVAAETLTVLYNSEISLMNKLSYRFIELLSKKASRYEDKIILDMNEPLNKQQISEESKALLSIIYRDYFCTEEEKENVNRIFKENEEKYRELYNPDNIFKSNQNIVLEEKEEKNEELSLVVPQKWYEKIFSKIKSIFSKSK